MSWRLALLAHRIPQKARKIHARADGKLAIVFPTVFHNSGEWAHLAVPNSQTGRSVVCGNLAVFAGLGFFIQAELAHLLQQKAVDVLEANEIVVTCRYRLQVLFAKDFLQRFLATFEWAHQKVLGELLEKGIIGFMGPRAVSGASARIVLFLFMRRTPFDRGPKASCWSPRCCHDAPCRCTCS